MTGATTQQERQLTVVAAGATRTANPDGVDVVTVAPGTQVTFTAAPDGAELYRITGNQEDLMKGWVHSGTNVEGVWVAKWTGGSRSNEVKVALQQLTEENPPEDDEKGVPEPSVGQYDWAFAVVVAVIFIALAVIVLVAWEKWIPADPLTAPASLTDGQGPSDVLALEAYKWQTRAVLAFSVIVIGLILLLVGSALAALEVRGRLRTPTDQNLDAPTDGKSRTRGPEALKAAVEFLEASGKVIEAAKWARGTVLVFLAGTAVVISSLAFSSCEANDGNGGASNPSPTPSVTPTPTASPAPDGATSTPPAP